MQITRHDNAFKISLSPPCPSRVDTDMYMYMYGVNACVSEYTFFQTLLVRVTVPSVLCFSRH